MFFSLPPFPLSPPYIPPPGVCSLVGNTILLYVSYNKKMLLKPAEFFIINLAVSDLGMTLSLYPLAVTSSIYHRLVRYKYLHVHTHMHIKQIHTLTYYLSNNNALSPSRSLSSCISLPLPLPLRLPIRLSSLSPRWLYGKTVCLVYAFCGVLFGICSLTTLTILSTVCCLKVCYPLYGKTTAPLTST